MKFTELLPEIQATYPEQSRRFHVLATRYYLGAESVESLRALTKYQLLESAIGDFEFKPLLSEEAAQAIIDNR